MVRVVVTVVLAVLWLPACGLVASGSACEVLVEVSDVGSDWEPRPVEEWDEGDWAAIERSLSDDNCDSISYVYHQAPRQGPFTWDDIPEEFRSCAHPSPPSGCERAGAAAGSNSAPSAVGRESASDTNLDVTMSRSDVLVVADVRSIEERSAADGAGTGDGGFDRPWAEWAASVVDVPFRAETAVYVGEGGGAVPALAVGDDIVMSDVDDRPVGCCAGRYLLAVIYLDPAVWSGLPSEWEIEAAFSLDDAGGLVAVHPGSLGPQLERTVDRHRTDSGTISELELLVGWAEEFDRRRASGDFLYDGAEPRPEEPIRRAFFHAHSG